MSLTAPQKGKGFPYHRKAKLQIFLLFSFLPLKAMSSYYLVNDKLRDIDALFLKDEVSRASFSKVRLLTILYDHFLFLILGVARMP